MFEMYVYDLDVVFTPLNIYQDILVRTLQLICKMGYCHPKFIFLLNLFWSTGDKLLGDMY